jgi:hypothetical protein
LLTSGFFYASWSLKKREEYSPTFEVESRLDSPFRGLGDWRGDGKTDKNSMRFTIEPETEISSQYSPLLTSGFFYASWSLKKREEYSPTFEVESRLDSPFRGLGDWRGDGKTDKNSMKFTIEPGETVCVRVRATDGADNTGPWSRDLCRTRYVDDRNLEGWRGSNKWEAISFSNNINGTALVSKSDGATVTLGDVRLRQLVLFGRKGPYGGTIEIRVGGELIDRISLKSQEPKAATLFRGDWREPRNGRFTIEVTSDDGRYVHLDALIVRR